jgi:hypothetical protein
LVEQLSSPCNTVMAGLMKLGLAKRFDWMENPLTIGSMLGRRWLRDHCAPARYEWVHPMTDIRINLEELRAKAADCELLASLATDPAVRAESRRRAAEYRRLIEEAEALLKTHAA